MLGRQDAENIYVMFSDHLHFWDTMQLILEPKFPWEFIQLGNCGSPIETEAGWLVISHGVGPMRKYCIGAFLLDRDDPTKVIGRLPEPLIKPNINERDGYVPNVVYSCGSLVHGGQLVIPYGISDYATTFATLPLDQVWRRWNSRWKCNPTPSPAWRRLTGCPDPRATPIFRLDRGVLSLASDQCPRCRPIMTADLTLGSVEKHDSTVLFQVFNPQIPLDLGTEVVA